MLVHHEGVAFAGDRPVPTRPVEYRPKQINAQARGEVGQVTDLAACFATKSVSLKPA